MKYFTKRKIWGEPANHTNRLKILEELLIIVDFVTFTVKGRNSPSPMIGGVRDSLRRNLIEQWLIKHGMIYLVMLSAMQWLLSNLTIVFYMCTCNILSMAEEGEIRF